MSRPNTIETARAFYLQKAQMQPDIEELLMMVLYADYLNSDSEGAKSAETNKREFILKNIDHIKSLLSNITSPYLCAKEDARIFGEYFKMNGIYKSSTSNRDIIRLVRNCIDLMGIESTQSRPQLTDEEIYDEVVVRYDGTKEHDMLRKLRFIDGAKWARTKLTGK